MNKSAEGKNPKGQLDAQCLTAIISINHIHQGKYNHGEGEIQKLSPSI